MSLIKYLLSKKYRLEISNEISEMCNGGCVCIESIYDKFTGETSNREINHNERIHKGD